LATKQDTLLKQWMEREKAAVDYARNCDKRIVELEADVARLQSQLRGQGAVETATLLVKNMSVAIEHLRAQLTRAETLAKAQLQNAPPRTNRLAKLEAVAAIANAGLTEELRILKKEEPALEESLLISDGDDLIPPRWLPLKTALQSLESTTLLETKKGRH
jgi:hypothetical protein